MLCLLISIVSLLIILVKTSLYIQLYIFIISKKRLVFNTFLKKQSTMLIQSFIITARPTVWTFRGQKSLISSRFLSLNFEGLGVCTLPLVFAFESVIGSFLQLYHNLVHKVCISFLRRQLIAAGKQSVEDIPPFLCCEIKAILSIYHTKITSALTVSVTVDRRAFVLRIHSI